MRMLASNMLLTPGPRPDIGAHKYTDSGLLGFKAKWSIRKTKKSNLDLIFVFGYSVL